MDEAQINAALAEMNNTINMLTQRTVNLAITISTQSQQIEALDAEKEALIAAQSKAAEEPARA